MDSKKKKELRNKIHQSLLPFYTSNNYKLVKKFGVFKKNEFEVSWGVKAEYPQEIVFRPGLRVSNDQIKKILSDAIHSENISLVTSRAAGAFLAQEFNVHDYDYLIAENGIDQGCTYVISEETDLSEVVSDHVNYMEKVGFPFFEKLVSIEGIDQYYNSRLLELGLEGLENESLLQELNKTYTKQEALSGVVAAYLVRRPKFDELVDRVKIYFKDNEYVLNDLHNLVSYLKQNPI